MAQMKSQSQPTEISSPFNVAPAELTEMSKRRLDEFTKVQRELLDKLQETSQHWFERAQKEATLASEFATKLTAARSVPDAMAAYQEWTTRHFELIGEDGKQFLADSQEFMRTGTRLLSNGSLINGGGASST